MKNSDLPNSMRTSTCQIQICIPVLANLTSRDPRQHAAARRALAHRGEPCIPSHQRTPRHCDRQHFSASAPAQTIASPLYPTTSPTPSDSLSPYSHIPNTHEVFQTIFPYQPRPPCRLTTSNTSSKSRRAQPTTRPPTKTSASTPSSP